MAESETKGESGGGGGGKLLLVLVAVNTLVSGGALAVSLLQKPAGPRPAAKEAEAAADHGADAKAEKKDEHGEKAAKGDLPGPTVKLPDFVVHLRDPEVDRYARITVEIEVADEKAKEVVSARMPAIRDSFIAYLSDRSTADLRGSEAIARAKLDLAERLKQTAPSAPVRGLFLTELVVQ
jgi:flagellar FliL protein